MGVFEVFRGKMPAPAKTRLKIVAFRLLMTRSTGDMRQGGRRPLCNADSDAPFVGADRRRPVAADTPPSRDAASEQFAVVDKYNFVVYI